MSRALVVSGPHGRVEVSGDVLDAIVGGAVERVDGVVPARGRRAVHVVAEPGATEVEVQLTARTGVVLPTVAEAAQRAIAEALGTALGGPVRVDAEIVGIDA